MYCMDVLRVAKSDMRKKTIQLQVSAYMPISRPGSEAYAELRPFMCSQGVSERLSRLMMRERLSLAEWTSRSELDLESPPRSVPQVLHPGE